MPPRVSDRARGGLAVRARGGLAGRVRAHGTGGREVKASSSSSTPGNVFGGVPGGAQYFREMVEAMWGVHSGCSSIPK